VTFAERHDAVVEKLAADLRALLATDKDRVVLTRVRCQLLDGFPTCLTTFDVAVLNAEPRWLVTTDGPVLEPDGAPVVGINVVTADSLEADTIRTPNVLARTAVSDYVLFDPSGGVMRPVFQAFWNGHGELNRSWPGLKGVFFSGSGFRLDVVGGELVASRCGSRLIEEELFVLRHERDVLGLGERDARIAKLEARLLEPQRGSEA
jgi:hypothetical protein